MNHFQGDEAEANNMYRVNWRPALLSELSRHAFPVHQHGLLGVALGNVEYATYSPNPFVARVAPPPTPDQEALRPNGPITRI
jgi:hypothetical protein